MAVGFPLEAHASIGLGGIEGTQEAYDPFQSVEDIEGEPEKLSHLSGMDKLMVDSAIRHTFGVSGKKSAEEIERPVSPHERTFYNPGMFFMSDSVRHRATKLEKKSGLI